MILSQLLGNSTFNSIDSVSNTWRIFSALDLFSDDMTTGLKTAAPPTVSELIDLFSKHLFQQGNHKNNYMVFFKFINLRIDNQILLFEIFDDRFTRKTNN